MSSHQTGLILNRLLKYDTLAQTVTYRDRHVPALKLYTIDQENSQTAVNYVILQTH